MSHKYIKIDLFFTSLDSDSTVSMVAALLPSDDPTVKEFLKYRRILKSTNDKLLRNFYDAALAKLQTAIIRRHRELMEKKDEKSHPLIKIAEKLLVHWNIYHFLSMFAVNI